MEDAPIVDDQYGRGIEYLNSHYRELLERYPERWIAIYNLEVVGVDVDFYELLADLRQRGIPPEHSLIEHLTRQQAILILHQC